MTSTKPFFFSEVVPTLSNLMDLYSLLSLFISRRLCLLTSLRVSEKIGFVEILRGFSLQGGVPLEDQRSSCRRKSLIPSVLDLSSSMAPRVACPHPRREVPEEFSGGFPPYIYVCGRLWRYRSLKEEINQELLGKSILMPQIIQASHTSGICALSAPGGNRVYT